MPEPLVILYIREDEKKHSVRFKESTVGGSPASNDNTFAGTIYVMRKSGKANAKKLRVTVEEVE